MNQENIMGELDQAAIAAHEMYSAFIRAGFSKTQAMQLLAAQMQGAAIAGQVGES